MTTSDVTIDRAGEIATAIEALPGEFQPGTLGYLTVSSKVEFPVGDAVAVRVIPDEECVDEMGSGIDERTLRPLGFLCTQKNPNPHLVVRGEDDVRNSAAAVTAATGFLWQADPGAMSKEHYEQAGVDDNGGEWD